MNAAAVDGSASRDTVLTVTKDETWLAQVLCEAGQAHGSWPPDTKWRRVHGRLGEPPGPRATLVFAAETLPRERAVIEIYDRDRTREHAGVAIHDGEAAHDRATRTFHDRDGRPDGGLRGAYRTPISPALSARVRRLIDDPGLPSLARFLETEPEAVVVRYRPGKRCTLFSRRVAGGAFAKLVAGDRAAELARAQREIARANRRTGTRLRVAECIGYDETLDVFWQRRLEGRPLVDRLSREDAPALAARIGEATGTIASWPLRPTAVLDAAAQLLRTRRYATAIAYHTPELRESLLALLDAIASFHDCFARNALFPIHGSPHAHQWLDDGLTLGLVDFDRISLGDPELDAATFLGELSYEHDDGPLLEATRRAYCQGFQRSFRAFDPRLLAAYEAHKHIAKALRCVRSLRFTGPRKARRALRNALAALEHAR